MMKVYEAMRTSRFCQLLLLTAATLAATYSRAALRPLQETMSASLALSDTQVAWLQGPALAIPMTLGSIPIGLLVDRFPRVHLFVVFVALTVAATAMTAFATSMPALFAARCLAGLASAGTLIVVFSVLSDLYSATHRGRAIMVTTFGEIGGGPAAFALGGALLAAHSAAFVPAMESWRQALIWMCAPLLAVLLLMLLVREPPRTDRVVQHPPAREAWARLWQYRAVITPMLLSRIMVWVADGAVLVWAAPNFTRNYALPPDRVGVIMASALLASGVLGPALGGPLADYCQRTGGPRRTMTIMCFAALACVPAGMFAILPGVASASVMMCLFLTLGFTIGTAELSLATIVVPGELRGLYIAITVTVGAIFSVGVAPVVVSYLSISFGGPAMIGVALAVVCMITSALGAVVFGFGRRYFPGPAVATP